MCKKCAVDDYEMVQKTVDGSKFVWICPKCGRIARQGEGKDCIVCLVGPSGTGKTSIAYVLKEKYGYNVIESYTTRPPRRENEEGHTFLFFENELEYENYMSSIRDEIIAYNCYSGHDYFATKEQYQGKGVSVYVVDVPGVKMLKKNVKDAEIVVIALHSDADTIRDRLNKRGDAQSTIVDRVAFDNHAFIVIPCDYSINANWDLYTIVDEIYKIIQERRLHW